MRGIGGLGLPPDGNSFLLFFYGTPTTGIYTLSLHDALPISRRRRPGVARSAAAPGPARHPGGLRRRSGRSEEHTSELQSRVDLVCRLLLEKKNRPLSGFSKNPFFCFDALQFSPKKQIIAVHT